MSKTSFKRNKSLSYEMEDSHHTAKKKKTFFQLKKARNLDNILRTKDVKRIMTYEEKF